MLYARQNVGASLVKTVVALGSCTTVFTSEAPTPLSTLHTRTIRSFSVLRSFDIAREACPTATHVRIPPRKITSPLKHAKPSKSAPLLCGGICGHEGIQIRQLEFPASTPTTSFQLPRAHNTGAGCSRYHLVLFLLRGGSDEFLAVDDALLFFVRGVGFALLLVLVLLFGFW